MRHLIVFSTVLAKDLYHGKFQAFVFPWLETSDIVIVWCALSSQRFAIVSGLIVEDRRRKEKKRRRNF